MFEEGQRFIKCQIDFIEIIMLLLKDAKSELGLGLKTRKKKTNRKKNTRRKKTNRKMKRKSKRREKRG